MILFKPNTCWQVRNVLKDLEECIKENLVTLPISRKLGIKTNIFTFLYLLTVIPMANS